MVPIESQKSQHDHGMEASPRTVPASAMVAPFDLVIFGATGDLSLTKLIPALFYRHLEKHLPEETRIFAAVRKSTKEEFLAKIKPACARILEKDPRRDNQTAWNKFADLIHIVAVDAVDPRHAGWNDMRQQLELHGPNKVRVFYFATGSDLFGDLCRALGQHKLITSSARVVLEKPIGHDGVSSQNLNAVVLEFFHESQIYRIDHYLGKESVQNLMVLRFANTIFEAVWNRQHIDHVQISVAETVGVGTRAQYFDRYGCIRDMIQNHLLQLVCLTAMEPPVSFDADSVRDEKLKVLQSLRPIPSSEAYRHVVIGQYTQGVVNGEAVKSYADDINGSSDTETFVAMQLAIENWRWAGVPFYIRTGKRLPLRASEIVVVFKEVPHLIFPHASGPLTPNRLVIRLQPNEGLQLHQQTKIPGPGGIRLQTAELNLSFSDQFNERLPDAYERLLMDVARGNQTLFMRNDEIRAAWNWIDPIRAGLQERLIQERKGIPLYPAGSWGPTQSFEMIARQGREWIAPSI